MRLSKLLAMVVSLTVFLFARPLVAQEARRTTLEQKVEELARLVQEQNRRLESQAAEIRELQSALTALRSPGATSVGAAPVREQTASAPSQFEAQLKQKTETLEREQSTLRNLIGRVRFGGSFRIRFDQITRHSGPGLADAINNTRGRLRARLDMHIPINEKLDVDGQLATGSPNDPISDDMDFTAFGFKNPFFLSRMYVTYKPIGWLRLRGGRIPEIFGEGSQFVFDPDLNFGGTSQEAHWDFAKHTGGRVTAFQLRAAQYILNHANRNGARDSLLFGEGTRVELAPGGKLRLGVLFNFFSVRRPDAIAVAQQNFAAAARTGPFGNDFFGPAFRALGLATPVLGFTGNRVILARAGDPSSAQFVASGFNTGELGVTLDHPGFASHPHLAFGMQARAARNFSSSAFRDAAYFRGYLGRFDQPRDWRFSYTYARKQPDAFLAPFSDSDLGTISGTNIRTHLLEVDYKLSARLAYQNLFYFIEPFTTLSGLAVNTPAQKRTFRLQSQMLFTF